MRIDQIKITNFRRFDTWEGKFNPHFNVIIGNNGTGKTAILDALKISLGAYLAGFSGRKFERIAPEDIRLKTGGTEDNRTLERVHPVFVKAWGEIAGEDIEWYRQIKQGDVTKNSGSSVRLRNISQAFEKQIQNGDEPVLPLVAYYTANRLWPRNFDTIHLAMQNGKLKEARNNRTPPPEPELSTPTSRLAGYRYCLYAQSNDEKVEGWIKRLELSALQRQRKNTTLEGIRETVLNCLSDFSRFYYDVQSDQLVVEDINQNILPIRLLSHGQRNLLSLAADLAYRCAMLNPALRGDASQETPGVVLIDELDLHLHPAWQRRIVEDFRRAFPKLQFITASHSPLIIQSLDAGQLIDLGPEVDNESEKYVGKSPEDILENVMNIELPQQSERWLLMYTTAQKYYDLLEEAQSTRNDNHLDRLRRELDHYLIPYEDNPAYAAFLERQRSLAEIDGEPSR